MKKIFATLFFVFGISLLFVNPGYSDTAMRDYTVINLAKGSFLKGVCQQNISSSTAKIGDVVYFINPIDVFIGTSKIIPKDSVYVGEVESVMEAVEGINASMKIKIVKVVTTARDEFNLDANVMVKGSTTIGGDLAQVQYYTKMPHYPGDWKRGALQFVPTTIRAHGQPVVLKAGDEVTFVMNRDISLYKPMRK